MRYNSYNLNIFAIIIIFFISSAALADSEGNASYDAIFRVGSKKKLYTKGDIFYSKKDITKCLRIEDIREGLVILKDVNSKENFALEPGENIPLEGTEIILEKTLKLDSVEKGPIR